jgi:hypothetical protein
MGAERSRMALGLREHGDGTRKPSLVDLSRTGSAIPGIQPRTDTAAVAVVREVQSKAWVLSGRGNPRSGGGFPLKAKLLRRGME